MIAPTPFRWDGTAMVPIRPRAADQVFVVGQAYTLVEHQQRSVVSHNHEFAWLAEAWAQLPEAVALVTPSPEHLRKRALIETGWYDETTVDAGSQAAALRVASFMRGADDLCLVVTRGPLVCRRVAKSQSLRAMGKVDWQRSKEDILGWVSTLIGVAPATLRKNTMRAA